MLSLQFELQYIHARILYPCVFIYQVLTLETHENDPRVFTHENETAMIADGYTRSPVSRSIENRNRPSLELQAHPDNPRLVYRDTEVFTKRKYTPYTDIAMYLPVAS